MRLITWTNEVTTCGCCGREELKGTYRIDTPTGGVYFGSTCAKKEAGQTSDNLKIAKSKQNINYDQVGYCNDRRMVNLLSEHAALSFATGRKRMSEIDNELVQIREEYKR